MKTTIIATALLLAGCSESDDRICGSLAMKLPYPAKTADDQRQVTYSCVERWAARLAQSKTDKATEVAEAAVGACEDTITVLAEKMRAEDEADWMEMKPGFWHRRAQFIAVQTRAGNCYPDA